MQLFYGNGGPSLVYYYNVSTLEDVAVGQGQVVLEGRERCSVSVPEEQISHWAGQQEMAGTHTRACTHARTHAHTHALSHMFMV